MTPLLNNRYRICQSLGKGGFGETFLAEDTYLPSGRSCVVKQLKPAIAHAPLHQLIQERFQREAAILEDLGERHAQIPRLYAYFAEQGQFYLVQEWIPGLTLREQIEQFGPWPESAVRDFLVSTLAVLEAVHQQGIIHRDIKPSNILLRQDNLQPVLIDFGAAKETVGLALDSAGNPVNSIAIGTPGFMPPEQLMGHPVFASDLYSLGLTAIYLLTGKMPGEWMHQGGPTWHQGIPVSSTLVAIVNQAIASNWRDRPSSAAAMRQALRSLARPPEPEPSTLLRSPPAPLDLTAVTPTLANPATAVLPTDQTDYRNRQILLNKVKNYWIKGVLETSLHDRALIELGLESRLDVLDCPWSLVWETPDQARRPLPPGTRVIHKFKELGAGRTLLILGEPGAGKTTTLLSLARDLLAEAEPNFSRPIPVVFNLSSWSRQIQRAPLPLQDWLVEELNSKYQVSREIARAWVQAESLVLLLDGLDEVSAHWREACVQALNQFSQEHGHTEMVVCSRLRDYEALSHRLKLQGALCLQPLNLEQIHTYLAQAGSELSTLNLALQADPTLQELAQSPLMLSIMTLAYRGMAIADLPHLNLEARRKHLFNAYIARMLQRRGSAPLYNQARAQAWLRFLAQRLTQQAETVFLIEQMQPDWLQTPIQRWLYAAGVGGLAGLICGLGGGIVGTLLRGPDIGLLYGWVFGLTGGVISMLVFGVISHRINPVETLKWSWPKAQENLLLGLAVGIFCGPVLGLALCLIYGVQFELNGQILDTLTYGVISGMGAGLIFVLLRGLKGPGIEMKTIPNQGIWRSAQNAAAFALIGVIGLTLVTGLVDVPLILGAISGLLFGLFGAGEACIQHLTLRLILYGNGSIPWNYAAFLNWATDRIFLQKVGGGYIFIHRLLLEHFAALELSDR